ncbi:hypothetical protein GLP31_04960 [Photobacterium carnosum]|uniref:hypothetical protein n=1 Tax=Photobacterium carnosum TaxID=2023717 RepID=UPI001E46BC98|nr:hypothetical protein [Photobacterium carnosum]MCD9551828.1 hypothetical protein [Photobacterium carnosum]
MLNEFHFDHYFLENETLIDVEAINYLLINKWANFGCLYYPFELYPQYLKSLELHDPRYVHEWQTAFSSFKCFNLSEGYRAISEHDDINEVFTSLTNYGVNTALVSPSDATALNMRSNISNNNGVNEVVKAASLNRSIFFNTCEDYSKTDIKGDDCINEVWRTRFLSVAKHCETITIIDRYLFENLESDLNIRTTSIKKMANLLRPLNKKFSLNIYSSGHDKDSDRHLCIEKYFRDNETSLDRFGEVFSYIEISSCSDDKFRDDSHDRFIRFDDFVISIGTGFEVFRKFPLRATSFSVKNVSYTNFTQTLSSMSPNRLWVYRW